MFVLVSNDSPPYCVTVTLDDWQRRVTRVVAREIRRYRDERGMSAQQLADRTAELGIEVPRSVLANLESGRRETVAVSELLVLAAALQVAPVDLLCPVGFDEQIEILPGRMVDPLSASRWVVGELEFGVAGGATILRPPGAGEESSMRLVERHAGLLEEIRAHEAEVAQAAADLNGADAGVRMAEALVADDDDPAAMKTAVQQANLARDTAVERLQYKTSAAQRYRETAAVTLRYIRAEMRRRGMRLPAVPPSLKLDDESGPVEGSETR
jgi:transcriptional regulator with XRE-family HTH domain